MQSGIYEGYVRHRRFEPVRHEFRVPLFMMYLDFGELPTVFKGRWFWSVERRNIASFRRRDHVGPPNTSLDQTIRNLVESRIQSRPTGPIRLLTHLCYFGYCFNPLSIYFCFDESGDRLHSVVAEVTNTPWGERHCYVLKANHSDSTPLKQEFLFSKEMHVSPFMEMNFTYRWHSSGPGETYSLHAENLRDGESKFDATLHLKRRELTGWSLAWQLIRHPLMTLEVIAKIHWQAFLLWMKNVPYIPHPKTCQNGGSANNTVTFPSDNDQRETNP